MPHPWNIQYLPILHRIHLHYPPYPHRLPVLQESGFAVNAEKQIRAIQEAVGAE